MIGMYEVLYTPIHTFSAIANADCDVFMIARHVRVNDTMGPCAALLWCVFEWSACCSHTVFRNNLGVCVRGSALWGTIPRLIGTARL